MSTEAPTKGPWRAAFDQTAVATTISELAKAQVRRPESPCTLRLSRIVWTTPPTVEVHPEFDGMEFPTMDAARHWVSQAHYNDEKN